MTTDERNQLWARALGISATEFAGTPAEVAKPAAPKAAPATKKRGARRPNPGSEKLAS